jgi:hypothetical protein
MNLRFRTTPWDLYWSLVHRVICSRGSLVVLLVIWIWAIYETTKKLLHVDLNVADKILIIIFAAIIWAAFLLALTLVVSACTTFFTRKQGLACEHTLRLLDEGVEEATDMNRSVYRWPMIKGMKKVWGMWVILGPNGIALAFRPSRILEGDPTEFARILNEKRG